MADVSLVRAEHIGSLLQDVADRRASHPAIIDAEGTLDWISFGQRLRKTAHALLALGLQPGDRVALLLPDTRAYLEADYGVMSAGLVRVPLDPRSPRADLIALLQSSGARALITSADRLLRALKADAPELAFILTTGGATDGSLDFDALVAAAPASVLAMRNPDDLSTLNYSGGTTGAPKGIALRHRNLCAVLAQTIEAFEIKPESVFLNVRPLWPIAQLGMMSHLAAGGTVVLKERFDPAAFVDLVAASGATRTSMVPTQLFRLLEQLTPHDPRLSSLEAIYIGGSRLPPEMFNRAIALLGPRIGVLYGMTEAPISCYLPPAMTTSEDALLSVGKAVSGCVVRILGPEGPTAAPDVEGEVLIQGRHVMQGYWRDPAASQLSLEGDWLHTGDLGAFDHEGRLKIVGRLKEVIRTGAASVVPAEVEDALMTHPAVAEAAVVGLPDPEWGEAVTAFVVLKPGVVADEATLIAHCRDRLASFKKPRAIRFVDALPRSHYGKVQRAQLIASLGAPR